jgi:hypothetical protein
MFDVLSRGYGVWQSVLRSLSVLCKAGRVRSVISVLEGILILTQFGFKPADVVGHPKKDTQLPRDDEPVRKLSTETRRCLKKEKKMPIKKLYLFV